MDLVPFPKEPDADFARALYASVEPIIEGCKDYEWRTNRKDLIHTRDSQFERLPWTSQFKNISFEVRMQLALAFMHMHGRDGLTPSMKHTDRRLYELQKFIVECPLVQWVWHEEKLRAGAMPIPPDMRKWELADILSNGSDNFFTLKTPRPPDIPMPRQNVHLQACEWYRHTCMAIAEGWYLPSHGVA